MSARLALLRWTDATAGSLLCRAAGTWDYLLRRDLVYPAPIQPDRVRSILVIRPGGMGDMVILLPVLARIRDAFPAARLSIVCETRNLDILGFTRPTDEILAYDRNPMAVWARLRRGGYDIAIDTEQFHHFSALFAYWSRAPIRVGFKINPRRNALYTHLVNYAPDGPEGDQFMGLLAPLGIPPVPHRLHGFLRAAVPADAAALRTLAPDLDPDSTLILHPGTSTPYKRWPVDRYLALARALAQQQPFTCVITGSASERPVAEALRVGLEQAGLRAYSTAGRIDIRACAALLRTARLFVGPDSGIAHLAVALGTPSVTLFGPSDAGKWGASDGPHAHVSRPTPCAPCFIFGYHKPCRRLDCMRAIEPGQVVEVCRRVLAAPRS